MLEKKSYYLIGIKGAGMSALANVLKKLGHEVAGSDIDSYVFTERQLHEHHIPVNSFSAENLSKRTYDVVVRGNVFNAENNEEVAFAEKKGMKLVSYHEMLRDLSNAYCSVAVTGTHGKTTTTGMLASTLKSENIAYLIGDGTGNASEDSSYFLFESCEYKRHFLWYTPDYQIVTNIDFDHPDYFKDIEDVVDAFTTSSIQVKKAVVAYGDDPQVQAMIDKIDGRVPVITFGEDENNDYVISNFQPLPIGIQFSVTKGEKERSFTLPFYGKHMMLNAVSTLIIADLEGVNINKAAENLSTFEGVDRRFNVEVINNYTVVDDYAHHPNEIKVTIAAARQQFPGKKIVAIFQPHTFSRTNSLADEFIDVLHAADEVYVTDIFTSAREQGDDTYPAIILNNSDTAKYLSFDDIDVLTAYENEVLIFMGAGNIQSYLKKFTENVENTHENV